jgi:hypothetical protein
MFKKIHLNLKMLSGNDKCAKVCLVLEKRRELE